MASRTIEIKVVLDLARHSKEAHEVTIAKIANEVGKNALATFEAHGYKVNRAKVTHLLHYVRHDVTHVLRKARSLRVVKSSA